jgi:hypothetical protein
LYTPPYICAEVKAVVYITASQEKRSNIHPLSVRCVAVFIFTNKTLFVPLLQLLVLCIWLLHKISIYTNLRRVLNYRIFR